MESLESLSNIDEILSVDGYDILIVGPLIYLQAWAYMEISIMKKL